MTFAHIEQRGKAHVVTLAEPQATRQAADRLRFANVHVLILRRTGDDALSRVGEIGQPELEILITQTGAAEAAVGERREQLFQSPLQVRPHPVRKIAPRDDEVVERERREVRGERFVKSDDVYVAIHISKENGEKPCNLQLATGTLQPATGRTAQQPWQHRSGSGRAALGFVRSRVSL